MEGYERLIKMFKFLKQLFCRHKWKYYPMIGHDEAICLKYNKVDKDA